MIVASREQVGARILFLYIRVGHDKPSLAVIQGLFSDFAPENISA
jgi:hypothetical protein